MKETEGIYRFARFVKQLAIGGVVLVASVIIFGYLFFVRQVNKQAAWDEAERELRGDLLQYGERVVRVARVYVRRPTNYFRAANGVLAATQRRVIFVGLEPRDKLASADAPAAILTNEFPNDTALALDLGRVYFLTAHGVDILWNARHATYASTRGHEYELDSLVAYVNRRSGAERRLAAGERALRAQVDSLLKVPLSYRVQRGDALSTIATRFGATQDEVKAWNGLSNERVKIGQTLLVKPAGLRTATIAPTAISREPSAMADGQGRRPKPRRTR